MFLLPLASLLVLVIRVLKSYAEPNRKCKISSMLPSNERNERRSYLLTSESVCKTMDLPTYVVYLVCTIGI